MNRSDLYARAGRSPITTEAAEKVFGEKEADYGSVLPNLERTAQLWEPILRCEVTAEQVCLCLMALKIARLCSSVGHRDSLVDVAGWAEVLGLALAERDLQDRASDAPTPEKPIHCPGCGQVSQVGRLEIQMLSEQEGMAVKCAWCGRIYPAREWVRGPEQKEGAP